VLLNLGQFFPGLVIDPTATTLPPAPVATAPATTLPQATTTTLPPSQGC
jgi:hypothetical protein